MFAMPNDLTRSYLLNMKDFDILGGNFEFILTYFQKEIISRIILKFKSKYFEAIGVNIFPNSYHFVHYIIIRIHS